MIHQLSRAKRAALRQKIADSKAGRLLLPCAVIEDRPRLLGTLRPNYASLA